MGPRDQHLLLRCGELTPFVAKVGKIMGIKVISSLALSPHFYHISYITDIPQAALIQYMLEQHLYHQYFFITKIFAIA